MKHLREKFEVMSEIAELIEDVCYDDDRDMYDAKKAHWSSHEMSALFVNGAWYMFKELHKKLLEQQKKIDKVLSLGYEQRGMVHYLVDDHINQVQEILE